MYNIYNVYHICWPIHIITHILSKYYIHAGETILTATFLLLGENVLTYQNGVPVYEKPVRVVM